MNDASALPTTSWPRDVSRQPTLRISDVLALLQPEFAAVTHSKLRFLEEQGLIDPVRSPSGYRHYSQADVERLRFVLIEQRDRYLPLKVIREKLEALDRGAVNEHSQRDADPSGPDEGLWPAVELDATLIENLIDAGVIHRTSAGTLDPAAVEVATIAAALSEYGIEPRHLRSLRTASDRHIGLVEQVVSPWSKQNSAPAREHATQLAIEIVELCARLHTVWVRQGIADLTN